MKKKRLRKGMMMEEEDEQDEYPEFWTEPCHVELMMTKKNIC